MKITNIQALLMIFGSLLGVMVDGLPAVVLGVILGLIIGKLIK